VVGGREKIALVAAAVNAAAAQQRSYYTLRQVESWTSAFHY